MTNILKTIPIVLIVTFVFINVIIFALIGLKAFFANQFHFTKEEANLTSMIILAAIVFGVRIIFRKKL